MIKFYQYKDSMVGSTNRKIYLDDLTLAYETLINQASRTEYDLYLNST